MILEIFVASDHSVEYDSLNSIIAKHVFLLNWYLVLCIFFLLVVKKKKKKIHRAFESRVKLLPNAAS